MGRRRRANRSAEYAETTPEEEREWAFNEAKFEQFYREQFCSSPNAVLRSADEIEPLLAAMRSPLPASFRISADPRWAARLARDLRDEVAAANQHAAEGGESGAAETVAVAPIEISSLPWIANGWQLSAPRAELRKHASRRALHRWLVAHEGAGTLTRQEAVSMVPALFVDVARGARLLGCAAPGDAARRRARLCDRRQRAGGAR